MSDVCERSWWCCFIFRAQYGNHGWIAKVLGTSLMCLFFYLLCYATVLKILTYYAQNYAHFISLCWMFYALSYVCKVFAMASHAVTQFSWHYCKPIEPLAWYFICLKSMWLQNHEAYTTTTLLSQQHSFC